MSNTSQFNLPTPNNGSSKSMSSREIAELTGKRHDHVCRDIDSLNSNYINLNIPKVGENDYLDSRNRKQKEFLLSRIQTFDLMTGYNTELRIKVNRRWEELETTKQLNFYDPNTVLQLAQNWADEQNKRLEAEKQLQIQAPKVVFTDAVTGSNGSCLIGELAKLIRQNGYDIGEKRLFKWLRVNKYIGAKGERYNIPMQRYIEQGLFELKKGVRTGNNGVLHQTITPKITGKGQVYFVNKFLNHQAVA